MKTPLGTEVDLGADAKPAKFAGVPQTNEMISAASGPKVNDN